MKKIGNQQKLLIEVKEAELIENNSERRKVEY